MISFMSFLSSLVILLNKGLINLLTRIVISTRNTMSNNDALNGRVLVSVGRHVLGKEFRVSLSASHFMKLILDPSDHLDVTSNVNTEMLTKRGGLALLRDLRTQPTKFTNVRFQIELKALLISNFEKVFVGLPLGALANKEVNLTDDLIAESRGRLTSRSLNCCTKNSRSASKHSAF